MKAYFNTYLSSKIYDLPLVSRRRVRGSDLLSSSFPFFHFCLQMRNEQRDVFQKIIETSHLQEPIIQYL